MRYGPRVAERKKERGSLLFGPGGLHIALPNALDSALPTHPPYTRLLEYMLHALQCVTNNAVIYDICFTMRYDAFRCRKPFLQMMLDFDPLYICSLKEH